MPRGIALMMPCKSLLFVVATFTPACVSYERPSMTYEECSRARSCTIRGLASARVAEHAWVAEVELSDGKCVRVSLPEEQLARLRAGGPRIMTVSGRVFGDPPRDVEVAYVEVEGRRIGLGTCGDFFVFVDA